MISRRGFFARLLGAAGAVAVAPHVDLTPTPEPTPWMSEIGRLYAEQYTESLAFHRHAFAMAMRPLRVGDTIRVKTPQRFDVLYGHGVPVTKVKV